MIKTVIHLINALNAAFEIKSHLRACFILIVRGYLVSIEVLASYMYLNDEIVSLALLNSTVASKLRGRPKLNNTSTRLVRYFTSSRLIYL